MPSSSVYATPIVIDLRPGPWQRGLHGLGAIAALAGLLLADLPVSLAIGTAVLVLLLFMREWRRARPSKLVLYVDGNVESQNSAVGSLEAANLLQSSLFAGLPQVCFADASGAVHACILFPDRVDSESRQRLRLWLATHRPDDANQPAPARARI